MIKKIILNMSVGMLFIAHSFAQPCYPDKIITAAYATGGSSVNKDKVLWLTWGSNNQSVYPYGTHNRPLGVGSKSYASIKLSEEKYLCIEATIVSLSGSINSYAPGNYSGDSLDDLYNIGGMGSSNKLVSGIKNNSDMSECKITIECKATINGEPIRISGLVIADAESLDTSRNEYIYAKAKGSWHIVELKKNTNSSSYEVQKINNTDGDQTIKFIKGNNNVTAAVSFLSFNEEAYNKSIANPDLSVRFEATLKGTGTTALALGLLTPNADLGDAPVSYGAPVHLLQDLNFSEDNILAFEESVIYDAKLIYNAFNKNNISQQDYDAAVALESSKNISSLIPVSLKDDFIIKRSAAYSKATNQLRANELRDLYNNLGVYNINTTSYNSGSLDIMEGSYLGSTAPDADATSLHSKNAVGDDNSGNSLTEENAWPNSVQKFSYKSTYAPGANFSVVIPFKNGKKGAKIVGWIDFDLNGTFDANEMAYQALTQDATEGTVTLSWTIPTTRKPYSTYARLRYIDPFNVDALSPTNNVYYGEVEDHRIYILGPSIVNPALRNKADN